MATFTLVLLVASLCSSLVSALPTTEGHRFFRRDNSAAGIIAAIMPSSTSCTGALFPDQCATNIQAAPFLIAAMTQYGVTSAPEIAAILSLVAVESGELKYRHSEFPTPVAGKGTSNMQSPTYNQEYAASIPALASGLTAANGDPDTILALVTPDEYNFGSGPWFLTTQCASIRSQLQANTDAGFTAYMLCVGAPMTDARMAYWHTAQKAFGL